jgi:O-antigen/teichoic acid export membrane protein
VTQIFRKSSDKTILIMIPAVLAVTLVARPVLMVWLGAEFAARSTEIADILIFGVLVNALARAPFALLQSCGFARSIAILQFVQLPLYGVLLWVAMAEYGLDGAAYVWAGRALVEAAALYILALRVEPALRATAVRDALRVSAVIAAIAPFAALHGQVPFKLSILVVVGAICLYFLLRDLKKVFSSRQLIAKDR